MVKYDSQALDTVFHALGDRTRRDMLEQLARRDCTVSELAEPFAMSLAAASKHIKVLEKAGLVTREVKGRTHRCSLEPMPLASAERWIGMYRSYWNEQLDTLEKLLRAESAPPPLSQPENRPKDINDD